MPSEVLLALHKHSHGLDPLRMVQAAQSSLQRLLYIRKIIPALEGIAAKAWRAGDLPELGASLTGAGRQVIAALWHFARCAQSAGYFFGLFFIHNPILSQSLWPVKLVAWTLILYGRAHPLGSLKPYSFVLFFSEIFRNA